MEQSEDKPELQPMSELQKAQFIQRRLSQIDPNDNSERRWQLSTVRLISPEQLWPNFNRTPISNKGTIIRLTPELAFGRKKTRGMVVKLTIQDTSFHAVFGLGAVGITQGGEIIIDCTQVERPTAGAQTILPQNTFMRSS